MVHEFFKVIQEGGDDLADGQQVYLGLLYLLHLSHDSHEVFQHDLCLLFLGRLNAVKQLQYLKGVSIQQTCQLLREIVFLQLSLIDLRCFSLYE